MIGNSLQPRDRFFLVPHNEVAGEFVVYDALLEQTIGQPHESAQSGMDMVYHLNRVAPDFMYS